MKKSDCYYGKNKFDIKLDLSLLEALNLVKRINKHYIKNNINKNMFFEYKGVNELVIRSLIVNYYHKYFRDKVLILKERVGLN